jgi:hypothetical protein
VALCHAFGFSYKKRLPHMLPMGIYTIPEITTCAVIGPAERSRALVVWRSVRLRNDGIPHADS